MTRQPVRPVRRGAILPLLGVCLIGLFAFVALAVDLGMLATSRTQCQNAADVGALVGARTLDNKNPTDASYDNNRPAAVTMARAAVTSNSNLSAKFQNVSTGAPQQGYITNAKAGVYKYDTTLTPPQFVPDFTLSAPPAGQSWTAFTVTVASDQPTYFMKVLGVNTMPTGATATAVHRPRDTAFVLDMTGSMAYASTFNFNGNSLNPDPLAPKFGHYVSVQSNLIASANQANGNGEAISRNNFTISTPGGLPIVRDFFFDPANQSNPSASAFPVTSNTSTLQNAFHQWSPAESGGNSDTYTAPTYDFTGYNANTAATPAPDNFGTMTDTSASGGSNPYVGFRWRRADGSINPTDATWATGSASTRMAANAIELLGYNVSAGNVRGGTSGSTTITTDLQFRDPVWEQNGYDLNIVRYRSDKGTGGPKNPGTYTEPLLTSDKFQDFSMGPGYWGKTFFVWPPDPRFDSSANTASPATSGANVSTGKDSSGRNMQDWRRRFFKTSGGGSFSLGATGINETILNTGSGNTMKNSSNSTLYQVNYPAVLAWLKTGPQTLPPNLRSGRVLYYSSIPTDVTGGSGQVGLDQVFWKNYIDYVIGHRYTSSSYLYGNGDSWSSGPTGTTSTRNVTTGNLSNAWTAPDGSQAYPYMRYNDNPNRPRLHLWFGPLSMMDFIANSSSGNWMSGTTHEAQCWQLKAGMNSVLDDIQKNHPNDSVGMVMFAYPYYRNIRVAQGQDFTTLKNALFYPFSLLDDIKNGDVTTEVRPYDSSFTNTADAEIPNANGSTDPNTGLAYAFNLLSPSASLPTATYGTVKGRRGASKVVIFETDGVPNSYASYTLNKAGYNTYYSNFANGGSPGNGVEPSMSNAVNVVKQIVKPMATTATGGLDSGLSLGNAPAKVYPLGFGDIFDPVASPGATFRPTALQFLADIGINGGTVQAGSTSPPSYMIITGTYQNRIDTLKTSLQRIFQSGLSVTLIE